MSIFNLPTNIIGYILYVKMVSSPKRSINPKNFVLHWLKKIFILGLLSILDQLPDLQKSYNL